MPELEPHPPSAAPTPPAAAPETGGPGQPGPARPLDYDPLTGLRKMSTTAGVGAGDYVAISPVAIVAALLGLASLLALLHEVFLVVPLAGVVCAVVAWRQVRNSNGTQTGVPLAAAGLALSVLIGGGVLGSKAVRGWTARSDEQAIAALIDQLGQGVSAGRYHDAYGLFSQRFRDRVKEEKFADTWDEVKKGAKAGNVRSMRWNGTGIEHVDDAGTGTRQAWAMMVVTFEQPIDPAPRWPLLFAKVDGQWVIDDFPDLFPPEKKPKK